MADQPPKTTASAAVPRPRRPPSQPTITTLVVAGPSGYVPVTASPSARPRVVTSGVLRQQMTAETRMASLTTGQAPRMPPPGYPYMYPPPVTSPGVFPPQPYGQHSFAAMAPYGYAPVPPQGYQSALLDSLPEAPNLPAGYAYGKDIALSYVKQILNVPLLGS